ncbi:hypothetical protein P879_06981 [Paragonimus westermani]|uniref:Tyrosine specific protein phosphatases domain-containing protein n=1 Tax=Paragonimus westermani TaxID=34504 RepID=A0A8T0DQF1_9TREM|nr:hypothetical protein P879_06981 [Paragonimus westermani]
MCRFTFNDLFSQVRSLGQTVSCVIDLTYTKYYNPNFLYRKGVRYHKIFVEGHNVPHQKHVDEFARVVGLERQQSPNGIIVVHCTHGVNRTGYLICRYLIDVMGYDPSVALKEFEIARGHPIERENYIDVLLSTTPSQSSSQW